MSANIERCAVCRGTIYYPTDDIGRVLAWCYHCRREHRAEHCTPSPKVFPPSTDEIAAMMLEYLAAHPTQCFLAAHLCQALGVAQRSAYRAIDLLVARQAVGIVRQQGFVRTYYTHKGTADA